METKPLLYGLIGFFLGGLLVSIAATTFNNDELQQAPQPTPEVQSTIHTEQQLSEDVHPTSNQ